MGAPVNERLLGRQVNLTASGGGTATGTITGVNGVVEAVCFSLGAGMLTMAATVTNQYGDILVNGVTITANGCLPIRQASVKNDNTSTGTYDRFANAGGDITVSLASATATKSVTVTVLYK